MNKFLIIGGHNSLDNNNQKLEHFLLSKVEILLPKILFFPTASLDNSRIINQFYAQFENLSVSIEVVKLFSDFSTSELFENIKKADILYFSGGNTEILMKKLLEIDFFNFVNKTPLKAIMAGVSAGAIIWFCYGMGDSKAYYDKYHYYNFKFVEGSKILPLSFCPHYQKDDLIIFNDEIKQFDLDAIALEDETAIYIEDDVFEVIKVKRNCSAYYFNRRLNHQMIDLKEKIKYKLGDVSE